LGKSGIYKVIHESKQRVEEHEVICIQHERFPPCWSCGRGVRFELVQAAIHIGQQTFFAPNGVAMTKDEALQAVQKAIDLARQRGATDAEIRDAAELHQPCALPDLTHEQQRGIDFTGGTDALSGSKPPDDLPDYPFPHNPLKP
jgi:hypothetical protein